MAPKLLDKEQKDSVKNVGKIDEMLKMSRLLAEFRLEDGIGAEGVSNTIEGIEDDLRGQLLAVGPGILHEDLELSNEQVSIFLELLTSESVVEFKDVLVDLLNSRRGMEEKVLRALSLDVTGECFEAVEGSLFNTDLMPKFFKVWKREEDMLSILNECISTHEMEGPSWPLSNEVCTILLKKLETTGDEDFAAAIVRSLCLEDKRMGDALTSKFSDELIASLAEKKAPWKLKIAEMLLSGSYKLSARGPEMIFEHLTGEEIASVFGKFKGGGIAIVLLKDGFYNKMDKLKPVLAKHPDRDIILEAMAEKAVELGNHTWLVCLFNLDKELTVDTAIEVICLGKESARTALSLLSKIGPEALEKLSEAVQSRYVES